MLINFVTIIAITLAAWSIIIHGCSVYTGESIPIHRYAFLAIIVTVLIIVAIIECISVQQNMLMISFFCGYPSAIVLVSILSIVVYGVIEMLVDGSPYYDI